MKTIKNTTYNLAKEKQANILKVPPLISPRPSESILVKFQFFKNSTLDLAHKSNSQLSVQVSKNNIKDIVKIKEIFPKLSFDVISSRLAQFKSYFKILDILYFVKDTNLPITPNTIESVIKSTYIFNNIVLVSYS